MLYIILKMHSKFNIIYRFSLALCLVLLCYITLCASANNSITIPFELVDGLTIIDAEVDGVHGRFLLDTGSDGIFIDGVISKPNHSILTIGGTAEIETRSLEELIVGNFVQNDLEAQIISLKPIEEHLGIDLTGIIGGHVFLPKVVVMDFKKSIIILSDKLSRKDKKGYRQSVNISLENHIPIAKIKIEGEVYNFALDSGSSIHFVDAELLDNLRGVKKLDESSTMKCLSNKNVLIQKARVNSLIMGDAIFQNQDCMPRSFTHVNNNLGTDLHGILSLSQLSIEIVAIDYSRGKFHF